MVGVASCNDDGRLALGGVADGVVGVDLDEELHRLEGGEIGVLGHLLNRFGVTLGDLATQRDVRLALDLHRGAVRFRVGDQLDLQCLTLGRGGQLALLGDTDAVVGVTHLLGERRVVDDDLGDLEAPALNGACQLFVDGGLDVLAVIEDRLQRHARSLGLDLVVHEGRDGFLGVVDFVHGVRGHRWDHLEHHHDRQVDDLVVIGLDEWGDLQLELLQVDIVRDRLDERDDHVEAGVEGAVVATESLDDSDRLLADDLDRHRHEDDEDHESDQHEPVGEDGADEVADSRERVEPGLVELRAVVDVVSAVLLDAIFVRHVVKPLVVLK